MRLNESVVQLRCREEDLEIVQSAVQSARDTYARIQGVNPPQVSVDHNHFLPGGPKSEQNGSSWYSFFLLEHKEFELPMTIIITSVSLSSFSNTHQNGWRERN